MQIGGQLAEAAPGVLLLSSSCLDARRAIALGQYVAAGEAAPQPGCPELSVPVATTLWTMVHEQGGLVTLLLLLYCCLAGCLQAKVSVTSESKGAEVLLCHFEISLWDIDVKSALAVAPHICHP